MACHLIWWLKLFSIHCVKNVHVRSCSGPYFPIFGMNMERLMLNRVLNYMLKVNNRSTRKRCEIQSKLTIKAPEQRQWHQPDIQIYWPLLVPLFLFAIRMWEFFRENCFRHFEWKMFFYIRVFFRRHWRFQGSRGREGTISFFSDIYLQLCMWDDYQVFLVASLVITRFRSRRSEVVMAETFMLYLFRLVVCLVL